MRSVPQIESLPIPVSPDDGIEISADDAVVILLLKKITWLMTIVSDDDGFGAQTCSQTEPNSIVRDQSFSKLLASRLKEKYRLEHGIHITYLWQGNLLLQTRFSIVEGSL